MSELHVYACTYFEASSPGGNLGFEPDLKLTEEMLELMEGKRSDTYRYICTHTSSGLCRI